MILTIKPVEFNSRGISGWSKVYIHDDTVTCITEDRATGAEILI